MRSWLMSFIWGNVVIVAEVLKWWAAKEILKAWGK